MMKTMKFLFVALIAALTLTACDKTAQFNHFLVVDSDAVVEYRLTAPKSLMFKDVVNTQYTGTAQKAYYYNVIEAEGMGNQEFAPQGRVEFTLEVLSGERSGDCRLYIIDPYVCNADESSPFYHFKGDGTDSIELDEAAMEWIRNNCLEKGVVTASENSTTVSVEIPK